MRIEVDKVHAAGTPFAKRYAPDRLTLDDEVGHLTTPAEVSGCAFRRGNQIRLQGDVKTNVRVRCDRCLSFVTVPVDAHFDVAYIPAADDVSDENIELQEDDLDFSVFEDGAIDLDELVREQVLLALPSRLLCREECRGLCPTCGVDLNADACSCGTREVDPRWSALKDLRF